MSSNALQLQHPTSDEYVVEQLLDHRPSGPRRLSTTMEYLVHWQINGLESDVWVREEDVEDDLVQQYWERSRAQMEQSGNTTECDEIMFDAEPKRRSRPPKQKATTTKQKKIMSSRCSLRYIASKKL